MVAWNVYLNGKKIETVFYQWDCTNEYVRESLINHDGFDPRIVVEID